MYVYATDSSGMYIYIGKVEGNFGLTYTILNGINGIII